MKSKLDKKTDKRVAELTKLLIMTKTSVIRLAIYNLHSKLLGKEK